MRNEQVYIIAVAVIVAALVIGAIVGSRRWWAARAARVTLSGMPISPGPIL
jgi:hypothetical protein